MNYADWFKQVWTLKFRRSKVQVPHTRFCYIFLSIACCDLYTSYYSCPFPDGIFNNLSSIGHICFVVAVFLLTVNPIRKLIPLQTLCVHPACGLNLKPPGHTVYRNCLLYGRLEVFSTAQSQW